jgi:hypothetical protein
MKHYFLLAFLIINSLAHANNTPTVNTKLKPGPGITIHLVSIGINENGGGFIVNYAVSDSQSLVQKIEKDSLLTDRGKDYAKLKVNAYNLTNAHATVSKIRKVLVQIISAAHINDYFVFYFGGISVERKDTGGTLLAAYNADLDNPEKNLENFIELSELASLFEQIKCEKQLIISEAGNGEIFSKNLIKQLFESNPLIFANTTRNRIIITTTGIGFEDAEMRSGALMYYLLNARISILDVFVNKNKIDFEICKAEIKRPLSWFKHTRYSVIYSENDYKDILMNSASFSRGSTGKDIKAGDKKSKSDEAKTYALLIATNNYVSNKDWKSLRNPLNDANAVGEILELKYNVIVSKQYDKSYREVLEEIIRIKK